MGKLIISLFSLALAAAALFLGCADFERDHPDDEGGNNYGGRPPIPHGSSSSGNLMPYSSYYEDYEYAYCRFGSDCSSPTGSGACYEMKIQDCYEMGGTVVSSCDCQTNYYYLTVNETPCEGGTINSSGTFMSKCKGGSNLDGRYKYGETAMLTAMPSPGYRFVRWTGDYASADETIYLTIYGNINITAEFEQIITGTFTDYRDYQSYKYVQIGSQTWMAENLNYEADGSMCYDNLGYYCKEYGRLYDWETAMNACPKDWHLPSYGEWNQLVAYIEAKHGCTGCAGRHLKATSGWDLNPYTGEADNSIDSYGFAALPGGGYSFNAGGNGYWWSASKSDVNNVHIWMIQDSFESIYWLSFDESYFLSVRCIND